MDRVYKIKYTAEQGSFTKTELTEANAGGTDALMIASVMRADGGSTSTVFQGLDGDTKQPLTSIEQFKIFIALASYLEEDSDLPSHWRELCNGVLEAVRYQLRLYGG